MAVAVVIVVATKAAVVAKNPALAGLGAEPYRPWHSGMAEGIFCPAKPAARLSSKRSAMARRVSKVPLAMCGVSTTLGNVKKAGSILGSS